MKTLKSLEDLQQIMTVSRVPATQNFSKNIIKQNEYNPRQNELYNRLLHGLSLFDSKQLYTMNSSKKLRIQKNHLKAQKIINQLKQEVLIKKTNAMMIKAFVVGKVEEKKDVIKCSKTSSGLLSGSLAKLLLSEPLVTDEKFMCNMSFKDLGINKDMIVDRFISEKLLPLNYKELA